MLLWSMIQSLFGFGFMAASAQTESGGSDKSTHTTRSTILSSLQANEQEIARIIGATELIQQIERQQIETATMDLSTTSALDYLGKRQKLIYLRQKLMVTIETANLQVNAVRGQIETVMAQVQRQQASMVERRARTLRRNTIINFVSGGLTKIAGYSISLGNFDLPSNILEVFDGTVQCGLSGSTIKDLHDEHHLAKELPPILATLEVGKNEDGAYPAHVWNYLNEPTPSPASKRTRRSTITDSWDRCGYFMLRNKASALSAKDQITHHIQLARITPQLLDDRLAMLAEVRSLVSEMHTALMQLGQHVLESYAEDPSFEWPVASKSTPIH